MDDPKTWTEQAFELREDRVSTLAILEQLQRQTQQLKRIADALEWFQVKVEIAAKEEDAKYKKAFPKK